jgi:hypothetical protein
VDKRGVLVEKLEHAGKGFVVGQDLVDLSGRVVAVACVVYTAAFDH